MKICHILTYTYENGGTVKFVYELAAYQAQLGDEVLILSTKTPGQKNYPVPEGVKLIEFKPEPFTKIIPLYSSKLKKYVKKHQESIDVFHLHCLWNYGELLTHQLGLHHKTLMTIHGSLHPYTFEGKAYYKRLLFSIWFQKSFLKKAKVIHVNHKGEIDDIKKYLGYTPDQIQIMPNGTALNKWDENDTRNRKRNEILYMGRLHHKKGFEILMPAFKMVSEKHPEAKLILAGPDEGMLDYIRNYIKENLPGNKVNILGTVSGEPKEKLLKESGIFILPTYSEGYSLAVLESLSYGIPTVVSDQTGLSPNLENYQAALVPELNPEAFADAISQLLTDDKLYVQLPQNGKRLIGEKLDKQIVWKEFNAKIYSRFR